MPLEPKPEECDSPSKNHPGRLVGRCHMPAKLPSTESHPRLPLFPMLFFSYNPVLQSPLPSSIPSNLPSHSIHIEPAPNKSVQKPGVQHALPCLLTDISEEACTGLFRDSVVGLVLAHSPHVLWKARVAVMSLPPWLEKSVMRADQFQSRQYKIPSPFAQAHLIKDM